MVHGPIFIGGLDRSGKTLLRLSLSLHPNIHITKRTDLWVRFYDRYGDLDKGENLDRCLSDILSHKHIWALKPDGERIKREFLQGEHSYGRLFALFHQHYMEQTNKVRWGDQSELIEKFADPIVCAYPDAKIIQLIRDPRDRYSAAKKKWAKGKGKVGAATARWMVSLRMAKNNLKHHPENYLIVRYESLAAQPEQTLREVCAFLGEEFTPEMLLIAHVPGESWDIIQPEYPSLCHYLPDFIGEYRGNLTKREVAFIQRFSSREMIQHNYPLKEIRFSPREFADFYLGFVPRNVLRMVAWKTLESPRGKSVNSEISKLDGMHSRKLAPVPVHVERDEV